MKRFVHIFASLMVLAFLSTACGEEVIIDPTIPTGTFSVARSGSIVEQNGTGSTGAVELGTDEDGEQFLRFGDDFTTNFATGTVTVYLSTSDTFTADPMNGNPDLTLLGVTKTGGEQYFQVSPATTDNFTHVILWCASANIPFGNAELN